MKAAAAIQHKRRHRGDFKFVVGRFFLAADGSISLRAVYCGPAFDIPRPPGFTSQAARFNRWRTPQAAAQFRDRHRLDAHVIDLAYLDVGALPS